ncbi:MAG: hypothetical protein HY243_15540 [Proteobacteria bacterium]|nr:hypothetical protein [Pseudomonadota bacterium]
MQRAQADGDVAEAAATKAYADYRKAACGKNASPSERNAAAKRLIDANRMLDLYVREEALLSPDVKQATNDSDQAAMAEMRIQSNPKTSAGDLAAARQKASDTLRKAQKIFRRRMDIVRNRRSYSGPASGLVEVACKRSDNKPNPKSGSD